MKTEIINEEKLEKVKKFTEGKWHKMENNTNSIVILQADSVGNAEYSEIADIDCNTLEKLGGFYGILTYFENGGQFMLKCETYMNTEEEDYFEERLSVVYAHNYDFLDLFDRNGDMKGEEKSDEERKWEEFNDAFARFIGENDYEEVIENIKENHVTFWEKLKEDVAENLDYDDVGDCLAEEVADNWIRENSEEAFDKALNEMSSYDLKDKIKEAIDSL